MAKRKALIRSTLLMAPLLAPVGVRAEVASPIVVTGWPVASAFEHAPPPGFGDDPLVGRQACPPLTRLNLKSKKPDDVLIRKVVQEFQSEQSGSLWRYEIRAGLFWWNGDAVTTRDVAKFLEKQLPEVAMRRGAGIWHLPAAEVSVDGDRYVTVSWKKAPQFGPYVLNGESLFRSTKDALGFECAGLYRLGRESNGSLVMTPVPAYVSSKPRKTVRIDSREHASGVVTQKMTFKFAREMSGTDAERCKTRVDTPLATLIGWNTQRGPTADPRFRALLTQLLPRGALLREGALALGELSTAPIPLQHPGYDAKVPLKPFDLRAASDALTQLGYKRKTAESPREDLTGKPLKLTIRAPSSNRGLAEKVVADALSAVGISITYVKSGEAGEVDGEIVSAMLDWPNADLLADFHSKADRAGASRSGAPIWRLTDPSLDEELLRYTTSLTTATPDFSVLQSIHRRLANHEPVSMLLQHRACFSTSGIEALEGRGPDSLDPDWFRKLLF